MFLFYFIIGSCFGSFVYLCAYRYRQPSLQIFHRSVCDLCHHPLSWKEMIPCLSWFYLYGKCRWCHSKIPIYSLFCELLGGILSVLIFLCFDGKDVIGVYLMVFSLLYCSCTDILYGLIPDRTHVFLILGALFVLEPHEYLCSFLVFLAVFIVLYFINIITEGLGWGDIKLITCLSLLMKPYLLVFSIAIASCSALIIFLPMFLQKKITRSTKIRFGPFLSFGALICLFFKLP